MPSIRLNNAEWTYDEGDRLGPPGGFGEVFRGHGEEVGPVAIKRLRLTAGAAAHREMSIGSWLAERDLAHVVPVLDYGQDANSDFYFLVMPICERSLQDEIASRGPLTEKEARAIALDILAGLKEAGAIVHRDLKPGNVLLLNGVWRLADFGIAKFVEDSTSLQTLRGSLTPAYGAPEQWDGEAPTPATDIYALGCIIHAMLTGVPPFNGSADDIREAHLHAQPPRLGGDPRLAGLVTHMLRKAPKSRPDASRCAAIIATTGEAARFMHGGLAAAGRAVAEREAATEAAFRSEQTRQRQRSSLIAEAVADLQSIRTSLYEGIRGHAESAVIASAEILNLGNGQLQFKIDTTGQPQALGRARLSGSAQQGPAWDVAATARIQVTQQMPPAPLPPSDPYSRGMRVQEVPQPYTWSALLFFGRPSPEQGYRWYEAAFWAMATTVQKDEPVAIAVGDALAAMGPGMTVYNLAYGPLPIDAEDADSFERRWQGLIAQAAVGSLNRPSRFPIDRDYLKRLTEG